RVVVRVHPHRERGGEARNRVRGLEHLARVERMEIREVVLHARGDLVEDARERRRIRGRRLAGKMREAALEALERGAQQLQRIGLERLRHGRRAKKKAPCEDGALSRAKRAVSSAPARSTRSTCCPAR